MLRCRRWSGGRWRGALSVRSLSSSTDSEYVVVGAGSAGCVVASRLAESGASVRLLEAGDGSTLSGPLSILTRMPTALSMPMHWDRWNWKYLTEGSEALSGKRVTCPRGRGLGGSSSINGMVYVRGHALDYEAWAKAGCDGWGWADVAPYFKKMENWNGEDDAKPRGRHEGTKDVFSTSRPGECGFECARLGGDVLFRSVLFCSVRRRRRRP